MFAELHDGLSWRVPQRTKQSETKGFRSWITTPDLRTVPSEVWQSWETSGVFTEWGRYHPGTTFLSVIERNYKSEHTRFRIMQPETFQSDSTAFKKTQSNCWIRVCCFQCRTTFKPLLDSLQLFWQCFCTLRCSLWCKLRCQIQWPSCSQRLYLNIFQDVLLHLLKIKFLRRNPFYSITRKTSHLRGLQRTKSLSLSHDDG